MKKFSRKEIDDMRNYFEEEGYEQRHSSIGKRDVSYFCLPQLLNPDLPNFVFRMTGEPEDGYVIGVSSNIPDRFKPYFALEEYIEFMEKGIVTEGRVAEAEKEVISFVPDALKKSYINMRLEFFRTLLGQSDKSPGKYLFSEDDVTEFRKNIEMLQKI